MAVAPKRRVVLLADDDVLVRNLIRQVLEAAGFLVLVAANATEALAHSREFSGRIHVLVTDVEMPGMDGITLASEIRKERSDTSVVVITAGALQRIPEGTPFISKPFAPSDLLNKLEKVLATKGSDEPA